MRFRFFRIELLAYSYGWLRWSASKLQEPPDAMGRFWRLVALTVGVEAILFLWVENGFRNY